MPKLLSSVTLVLVGAPWAVLVVSERAKRADARALARERRFLRLNFDTRLGMHSPR